MAKITRCKRQRESNIAGVMNKNGFKEVTFTLPQGAEFSLSAQNPIRSGDCDQFFDWLNQGRERLGMVPVTAAMLELSGNLSINDFNRLAENGLIPTDHIIMGFNFPFVVVAGR